MDEELARKVKKSRLTEHENNSWLNPGNEGAPYLAQFKTDSFSQNNTGSDKLMCSYEKIKIEFNVSSGETSSLSKQKYITQCSNITRDESETNNKPNSNSIKSTTKDNLIASELLSMDDSLLGKVDLSFKEVASIVEVEQANIKRNEDDIDGIQKLNDCLNSKSSKILNGREHVTSPDLFNCNQEDTENSDPDDLAWDTSITVVEDKDKLLNKDNSICPVNHNSPGLSDLVLSTWVSSSPNPPKAIDELTSFEDLLKKTLSNNAHKKITQNFSPKSLFSPSGSKTSKGGEDLFYGLPLNVKRLVKRFKGINSLYEWQEECLCLPAIKLRKNLVYALPTSGGKTLVAEILLLKELLCREKNVLFVLPYVSITQEKVRALSPFAVELGFLVEEYAGSKGTYPPQKRRRKRSVYVATIEKALGLVHSLIECQRLQELGLVVVDELHLIGEPKRGPHLESMLTKLMYLKGDIQIIGMSATIGNLADIASYLGAHVYTQDFRPVELTEFVKVGDELFKVDHTVQDEVPLVFHSKISFQYSQEQQQQDPDWIGGMVREVAPEHSCLVFCPSKKNCENVALLVCNAFDRNAVEYKSEEKKALFRALLTEGNGTVCSILRKTLPFGVAYHHSGLTTAERSLLEEAFLAKTVCCICCTSTLAAGVNLPARRVILRSPYIGAQLLTLSKYKQMVGRAGRTGMGDVGESFLLCTPKDAQKVGELLSSGMDLCNSQLQGSGLASLVISALDLGLASDLQTLATLCRCSLLSVQASHRGLDLDTELTLTLDRLVHAGAIVNTGSALSLSNVGKAAVKGNLEMETAKQLYSDLRTAQDSLVLLSHLHLLYLVTPYTMMDQIHFHQQHFCSAYMELGSKEMQTAKVLGIGEQCIAQLMTGRSVKKNLSKIIHRFYLSLILLDLWNQNSIWKVSNKYLLPRGLVHNLLVSASAFSASVVRFCEVLDDMWCFKLLLSEMSSRLTHCCTLELLPLMDLPAVKIGRAKQLYNAGFKTLSILAKTEPKVLAQAVDHMPRRVAHQIVAAAKLMLLAKAESLQEEAEDVLEGL